MLCIYLIGVRLILIMYIYFAELKGKEKEGETTEKGQKHVKNSASGDRANHPTSHRFRPCSRSSHSGIICFVGLGSNLGLTCVIERKERFEDKPFR